MLFCNNTHCNVRPQVILHMNLAHTHFDIILHLALHYSNHWCCVHVCVCVCVSSTFTLNTVTLFMNMSDERTPPFGMIAN